MIRTKRSVVILCAGAVLGCAGAAQAQFSDNFDSYTPGTLCPQGGWSEWAGSVDVCGEVTTEQAASGKKSLKIIGATGTAGDDTVHTFTGMDSGIWEFKIKTYVPSKATGAAYIILLNSYPAPLNWSLQVRVDGDTDFLTAEGGGSEQTPLIQDQWVEFRAVIDLDNDLVDYFYNGVEFVTDRSWTNGLSGAGVLNIAAIDLYGNEPNSGVGTTGTYFDDVSIQRPAVACPCDFNGQDGLNSQDFFDFLVPFFENNIAADFNDDGVINSQDFFDFLSCFFAPPAGC